MPRAIGVEVDCPFAPSLLRKIVYAGCQSASFVQAVKVLIATVARRLQALGPPTKDESETSPRKIVAKTLGYLKSQQSRMKYHEYRKQRFPITSSYIESTIKQVNRRVKGSEKFWAQGAEPILQLAADHYQRNQRP